MNKKTSHEIALLIREDESEYLDFKEFFTSNNAELVHDILCLCNSDCPSDRYLIFGVSNDKKIRGVSRSSKCQADIVDCLRSSKINLMPDVLFYQVELNSVLLEVLQIKNSPNKPYFLLNDKREGNITVRAGVVYTRDKDTNTPINSTASQDQIKNMWLERFGLDKTPTQRINDYLKEISNWKKIKEGEAFYQFFPEFKIVWSSDEMNPNFHEYWINKQYACNCTQTLVKAYYNTTQLAEFYVINLEHRSFFPVPTYFNIDKVQTDGRAYIFRTQIESYICAIIEGIENVEAYDESFRIRESLQDPLDVYIASLKTNLIIYSLNIEIR